MGAYRKFKKIASEALSFSRGERRGVLWLLPLIIVISVALPYLLRPRFDAGLRVSADLAQHAYKQQDTIPQRLFRFDPNTSDYHAFRQLGLDARTAASLIKYRAAGKVFRIPEDLAACYGVSDSLYCVLEPYIYIGEKYRQKKSYTSQHEGRHKLPEKNIEKPLFRFDPNVVSEDELCLLGFSPRQAAAIVTRREQLHGFADAQQFGECYVVNAEMFDRLLPFMDFTPKQHTPLELNGADSVALLGVHGIGSVTAGRIVAFRRALGGFANIEQLRQVRGVTEENFQRIVQEIWVDTAIIQKIDINFALPKTMAGHPYVTPEVLRKIVKNRQLKGGWSTTESMIEDGTLLKAQAERLAPYLMFTPIN